MTCVCHGVGSPVSERGRQREREQRKHDDGDDDRHRPLVRFRRGVYCRGQRGDGQDEHRQGEHQSEGASVVGGEALAAVLDTADHECQPEHQQGVGEDRADDGGLHHAVKTRPECEHDDEQLGQVAQRRLQYPRGVGPDPVSSASTERPTKDASVASGGAASMNASTAFTWAKCRTPAATAATTVMVIMMRSRRVSQREPFGMGGRHALLLL